MIVGTLSPQIQAIFSPPSYLSLIHIYIELLLNLSDAKAGNAEAYLFTPVLRGAGRLQELPAVVVLSLIHILSLCVTTPL